MYSITTCQHPTTRLAGLLHSGSYQGIGATFERLIGLLRAANLFAGSGPLVALYYDDPATTPVADLRAHAALTVPDDAAVPDDLDTITLTGGRVLVLTHTGPYAGLAAAWQNLYGTALPERGETLRDAVPYERYLTNPWETSPADHVTEICVPIA